MTSTEKQQPLDEQLTRIQDAPLYKIGSQHWLDDEDTLAEMLHDLTPVRCEIIDELVEGGEPVMYQVQLLDHDRIVWVYEPSLTPKKGKKWKVETTV